MKSEYMHLSDIQPLQPVPVQEKTPEELQEYAYLRTSAFVLQRLPGILQTGSHATHDSSAGFGTGIGLTQ